MKRAIKYLGREYPIRKRDCLTIKIEDGHLVVPADCTDDTLRIWLKGEALRYISRSLARYSAIMDAHPTKVRLSDAKSRWGYCNYKNGLGFSWRLIFCPEAVLDYVVVHELAHIRHKNHQKGFWNEVGRYIPDYKERRGWLKNNGRLMNIL